MIDAPKVFGIWDPKKVVKAVLVMQLAALIPRAIRIRANVTAKLALVVQHVIHASRAFMAFQRMDVNVSDFSILFISLHKIKYFDVLRLNF